MHVDPNDLTACNRCARLDVRCDRRQPTCTRCDKANVDCSPQASTASSPSDSLSENPYRASPTPDSSSPTLHQAVTFEATSTANSLGGTTNTNSPAPDSAVKQNQRKAKKSRRRACLSCTRCHRLKVKCDKKEPCSRCRLSGFGRQCEYTHRIESAADVAASFPQTPPYVLTEEPVEEAIATWHSRHRGLSHWRNLLSRLGAVARPGSTVSKMATEEVIRRNHDCASGVVLPNNFPFNSPRAVPYMTIDKVRELIASHRDHVDAYIAGYISLYQAVHPILDEAQFHERVERYWEDPASADVSWLSQFLMVLALGQITATRQNAPSVELCMAAEACLAKTPFMLRPNISTIRTFCLMVLAIQSTNGTCWAFDGCWNLLGLVVRLAICLGFHRPDPPPCSSPVVYQDWKSGQVLWATILYFNIQVSIITGMPSCVAPDEVTRGSDSLSWSFSALDSAAVAWQAVIFSSCPTILRIISRVNTDNDRPSYEEILEYSSQVRQLMGILDRVQGRTTLRITLDVFFRRVLLVLHRPHALDSDAPTRYPVSYWASLECSLALLVHQRELADDEHNAKGCGDLICRPYMLDVFAAAVTAAIHLLRKDAPLAAGFAVIPPRQTILDTLVVCRELWAQEKRTSPCFRIGHELLDEIVSGLSANVASFVR